MIDKVYRFFQRCFKNRFLIIKILFSCDPKQKGTVGIKSLQGIQIEKEGSVFFFSFLTGLLNFLKKRNNSDVWNTPPFFI